MLSEHTARQAAPRTRWAACRRVVAAASFVAAAATGGGVAAAAPPELRSSVVVSGTTTGYTDVMLPRGLSLPGASAPALKVAGSGFTGLALVRVQRGEAPPGLVVTRLAGTGALHYAWIGHERGTFADDDPPTYFTHRLPAGRYRLYLLTASRTTVTWTLPLRSGRAAVTPRTRTRLVTASMVAPGRRGTAVAPAYAGQHSAAVAHRGLALDILWYDAPASVAASFGGCTYPGESSVLGLGPAPACLDRDVSSGPIGPATDERRVSQGTAFLTPGTWTSKSYVLVAGTVRDGGIAQYLLDLGAGFPRQ